MTKSLLKSIDKLLEFLELRFEKYYFENSEIIFRSEEDLRECNKIIDELNILID
ncbi:hypothetical protein [Abyssisolibacter fermentans]|uniref:hypothetical protein n=1 Tax=Abyssisolibacter fermentans TaxID=1766203 RepID=UPI0012E370D3|nr:hypothetical protein [Abyssisolibacter fermentans]